MTPLCSFHYRVAAFASQNAMPPSRQPGPCGSSPPARPLTPNTVLALVPGSPLCGPNRLEGLAHPERSERPRRRLLASVAPGAEHQPPALAAARPAVVPPAPLFMLCGGLQEGPSPKSGSGSGSGGGSEVTQQSSPMPSGQKRLSKRKPQVEGGKEPAARDKAGTTGRSLSLVSCPR